MRFSILKISILFIFLSGVLSACNAYKASKALVYMNKKHIKPEYESYQDKSIIFVPIVHFGKEAFYQDLKDSVVLWKNEGYTVFFEQIIRDREVIGMDSTSYDYMYRKANKFIEFSKITREYYAKKMSKTPIKGIAQPHYNDLGLDSNDLNADINISEMVDEYERIYGEIILQACDSIYPLDSNFSCSRKNNSLDPIIHDLRNKELVRKVVESKHKKIVVLYGALHIKPMIKLLKEEDKKSF